MPHPVYLQPEPELTFRNFGTNQHDQIFNFIDEAIQRNFQELNKIRICADNQNDSWHLLNAIANELISRNKRISLLKISQANSWNELGIRHFNMMQNFKIVLIHHLDLVLIDPIYRPEFLNFYNSFAHKDTLIIYSTKTNFTDCNDPMLDNFLGNTKEIRL